MRPRASRIVVVLATVALVGAVLTAYARRARSTPTSSPNPAPLPSNAKKVNAYEPLLRRATECRRLRKRVPNLLAVNFYREGDLFRVVDELNQVGPRQGPE